MKRYLVLIMLLGFSVNAVAARVSVTTTIDKLYSYSEQPGFDGDIAIVVSNPPAGCEGGFWLRSADTIGFRNTLSFLLSAFHAGTTVHLGGLNDQIWSGSGSNFCRLDEVTLFK